MGGMRGWGVEGWRYVGDGGMGGGGMFVLPLISLNDDFTRGSWLNEPS